MEPRDRKPEAEPSGGATPAERTLLDAALAFYGAASAVIEHGEGERPRLRPDAAGLRAVREAMGVLDRQILAASRAGLSPQRIAGITRLELEIVELILRRGGAEEPDPARAR